MKKIRVTVEFPFVGVSAIEEYYDLPGDWDSLTEKQRDDRLIEMAVEELNNSGVGSGATVVEVSE